MFAIKNITTDDIDKYEPIIFGMTLEELEPNLEYLKQVLAKIEQLNFDHYVIDHKKETVEYLMQLTDDRIEQLKEV